MLHALRQANPQQSNDQGETESISYQAWRIRVTVWLFYLLAGSITEETSFLRHHAEESFRKWLRPFWCLLLLWRRFTPNQINIFFLLTIQVNREGRPYYNCPVQPSDLLLIHNHIMEALSMPDTEASWTCGFQTLNHCLWICILKLLLAQMGRKVWSFCSSSFGHLRNNKEDPTSRSKLADSK